MGKRYALRSDITPGMFLAPQQKADIDHRFMIWGDKGRFYQEVAQIVAEMDNENGRWAIFSAHGERLTSWRTCEVFEKAERRKKTPDPKQFDGFHQPLAAGDYAFSHDPYFKRLDLSLVTGTTKSRCGADKLSDGHFVPTSHRDPYSLLHLPAEAIEGGTIPTLEFDTIYAVMEERLNEYNHFDRVFMITDETTARKDTENGYFSYVRKNSQGVPNIVTGWVKIVLSDRDEEELAKKRFGIKPIVASLETPLTEALGLELFVGDRVITGDNQHKDFMLAQVIGFTDNKVRLLGYKRNSATSVEGHLCIATN